MSDFIHRQLAVASQQAELEGRPAERTGTAGKPLTLSRRTQSATNASKGPEMGVVR